MPSIPSTVRYGLLYGHTGDEKFTVAKGSSITATEEATIRSQNETVVLYWRHTNSISGANCISGLQRLERYHELHPQHNRIPATADYEMVVINRTHSCRLYRNFCHLTAVTILPNRSESCPQVYAGYRSWSSSNSVPPSSEISFEIPFGRFHITSHRKCVSPSSPLLLL